MIKFEATDKNMIVFSCRGVIGAIEDFLYLTPKETFDSIKELRKGLFTWHELTGEPVDKPNCH